MRDLWRLVTALILLTGLFVIAPAQSTQAGGGVGDGTPDSCTESALETALTGGGPVVFDCGPDPITIGLTSEKMIADDTQIDGGGLVTLDGQDQTRIFSVQGGATLDLADITLTRGDGTGATTDDNGNSWDGNGGAVFVADSGIVSITSTILIDNDTGWGAAVFNDGGTVSVSSTTFSNNTASEVGAAVYSRDGTLAVTNSTFSDNQASCGGGAIVNQGGTLTVTGSAFFNNVVTENLGGSCGNGGGIFNNGGTLAITSSTFSGNAATRSGGAISNYSYGTVTITDSDLSDNATTADDNGGGAIFQGGGSMTITTSTLSYNAAGAGGAVYSQAGTLDIINSTLSNNDAEFGGTFYNNYGTVVLTTSTFNNNSATDSGGALYNFATLELANSTVSGNTAENFGGGIYNTGTLTISNSTISDNHVTTDGGGIFTFEGTLTITDSTLSNNDAGSGGALFAGGDIAEITSSTLTGNSGGGAVYVALGSLTILSSTLADNDVVTDGGALYAAGGTTTVTSSIVSGNAAINLTNCIVDGGTITSGGYNLSDENSCDFSTTGDVQNSANVSLGALADNGGPTQTMQPNITSSDAVGAADCSLAALQDQRGVTRATSGITCDIGAVETGGLVPVQLLVAYNESEPLIEGEAATINAVATGPAGISYDYGFDCDDSGDYETSDSGAGTSGTASCTFDNDGTFTINVQVCDATGNGNCDTSSIEVTVSNLAPVVSTPTVTPPSTSQSARTLTGVPDSAPSASDEGTSVVASATFYDPGIPDFHTCTVDYGDGSGPQPGTVIVDDEGDMDVCTGPEHTYIDDNPSGTDRDPYTVTVEVIDDAGHPGDNYTVHYVDNVPPTIDAIETGSSGDSVTISVEASDVGIEDVLTYHFDCDNDGSYETEGVEGQGECSLGSAVGTATIGVLVIDDDTGEAASTVTVDVPVTLCVNYLTQVVSAAGSDGCATGTVTLLTPESASSTFCISPGLGKLRWSFDGQCSTGQATHIVPDDGPIDFCRTPYLGLLRVPEIPGQCTAYEIAGQIRG